MSTAACANAPYQNPYKYMKNLSIRAESHSIPAEKLAIVNSRLQTLVNTISIDFADTGFYVKSTFKSLELVLNLSSHQGNDLEYTLPVDGSQLYVQQAVPLTALDLSHSSYELEQLLEQAVLALAMVAKRYGGDSRQLELRAFHIRGEVARRKIQDLNTDEDLTPDDITELQIHMRLSDDGFGSPDETDFFLTTFFDTIASMIEGDQLGDVNDNDVGAGYFVLYCEGEDPRKMLNRIKPFLTQCSKSKEDFVILRSPEQELEIAISDI